MVTRLQIERLEQQLRTWRTNALASGRQRSLSTRFWITAWRQAMGEVVTEAELEARLYDGWRIVYAIVDPVDRGTACCAATGEEIPESELEARPCAGRMRIVHVYVDPKQAPAGKVA